MMQNERIFSSSTCATRQIQRLATFEIARSGSARYGFPRCRAHRRKSQIPRARDGFQNGWLAIKIFRGRSIILPPDSF
jgi:hypothetical protein